MASIIQTFWYYLVKLYVWLGLTVFYRSRRVTGAKNLPKGEATILAANHQNAFMDALLATTAVEGQMSYLVRADIFENPIARWLLGSLNMMPIYRIRDGWKSLAKNEAIFQRCYRILAQKKRLLIFPEGNHHIRRRVRMVSKGFTRLAEGAIAQNPDLPIYISPVGINYTNHPFMRESIHIIFGKPILANPYIESGDIQGLKNTVAQAIKQLTTHIEDTNQYEEIASHLDQQRKIYLNPSQANVKAQELASTSLPIAPHLPKKPIWKWLGILCWLPWLPILLGWWKLESNIKDLAFLASLKFAFGIGLIAPYTLLLGYVLAQFTITPLVAIWITLLWLFILGAELRRLGRG